MIICIQCAMEAMIAGQQYTGSHDATPELHMKRVHPDPQVTQARRGELEKQIAKLIEMGQGLMRDAEDTSNKDGQ